MGIVDVDHGGRADPRSVQNADIPRAINGDAAVVVLAEGASSEQDEPIAVDDEILAPLTSPSMTTPCHIVVMPSGACGPPARCPRGAGGLAEASSASCCLVEVLSAR